MADVTIEMSPEVKASDTFRPLVERANEWLRASMPESDFPVRAEWTLVTNPGGDEAVALTLKDEFSSPTRLFWVRNLQDRRETEHDIDGSIRILLRHRTHQLMKRFQASLASSGE